MQLFNKKKYIILGNQKSGTTAIAALLSAYAGIPAMLDVANIYLVHTGEMEMREFIRLNKRNFSKSLLKEPMFTFIFDQIYTAFPYARYLFIIRDPRENIRSLLNRLNIDGNMDDLTESGLRNINPAWRKVFEKKWLGLKGENYIEVLAARWNYAVDVYLKHKQQMLLVSYESFLQNKLEVIESIATEFGLRKKNDISQILDYQFQPLGDHQVSIPDFFGEKNLKRIERICAERMKIFGYLPYGKTRR